MDEGYYEDEYDEYEEGSEPEVEDERVDVGPTKDEQDFLLLREQLKEQIRQKLKQSSNSRSHSQDRKRPTLNDNFGSFFGPSQPAIAPRVLAESRSIRETQLSAKIQNISSVNKKSGMSSSKDSRPSMQQQQPRKVMNEAQKKVQTLRDSRDYSFLLSDDADFPSAKAEPPTRRPPPAPSSMGRATQLPLKNNIPLARPAKILQKGVQTSQVSKNMDPKGASTARRPTQTQAGPRKEDSSIRPKQAPEDSQKLNGRNSGHGLGRSIEHKTLPQRRPLKVDSAGAKREMHSGPRTENPSIRSKQDPAPPLRNMIDQSAERKILLARRDLSSKNSHSEQRRVSQGLDKPKPQPRAPMKPSQHKVEPKAPSKNISSLECRDAQPKKPLVRPQRDDDDPILQIRKMFGYDPRRYAGSDEDDSDMEVGFGQIEKEERRSARIGRKEDEEDQRLTEELDRRERMLKKQKLR